MARRPDNSWSAPSAIGTFGAGVGGQLGVEITDFVFILNDADAVLTFAQAGSITLGGNVSVAAGPVGRNAEAAGAASLRSFSGIFSYSKTKGLFAGVSLEGSAILERKDANEKLYGQRFKARELLLGAIEPPAEAAPLLAMLNSAMLGGGASMARPTPATTAVPPATTGLNSNPATGFGQQSSNQTSDYGPVSAEGVTPKPAPAAASTAAKMEHSNTAANSAASAATAKAALGKAPPPPRPTGPKPTYGKKPEAIAMYTFDAVQEGDLGFVKGDIITLIKKTDNESDWW